LDLREKEYFVEFLVMSNYIPPELAKFFIFNPNYGPTEKTEHLKILYFHPEGTSLDSQQSTVGLSEGLINFTRTFGVSKLCETVHTKRHKHVFYEPEPDHWLVMVVQNPKTVKSGSKEGEDASTEYLEDQLDDISLHIVLEKIYYAWKIFNGPFLYIVDNFDIDTLRSRLKSSMPVLLKQLDFNQVDLFSTLDGIHFLPVNKNVYLRIQSFINLTENTFDQAIVYSTLLYKDNLVWSGLDQEDMRTFYKYLMTELKKHNHKTKSGFLKGPENLTDPNTQVTAPLVFIGPEPKQYYLIIYQQQDITCMFLINSADLKNIAFYRQLTDCVKTHIDFLSPIIAEHYSRKQGVDDEYRYIYFNHMNLALKTSLKHKGQDLTPDIMRILNEMHSDFEASKEGINEVLIRTQNDGWVVGKKSDQREFYVIFDQKSANLIEINEEVKKLSSTYFNNIFID